MRAGALSKLTTPDQLGPQEVGGHMVGPVAKA